MFARNGIIAMIIVYVLFVCATVFAQDGPADGSAAPMQEGANATRRVDTLDDAVANDPQASERVEGEAPTTSRPVIGLADLHLHQWAHFMNGGQWMFGDASGVAHEHLTECGWHTGDELNYEGRVRPRQRHGQGIGHRRAGRTLTRALFGAERNDDVLEQHPPAGISRDELLPHWMGWPTSDSIAHQQVWQGWLRLAHDGLPFLHFMHGHPSDELTENLRQFYAPGNYLTHVRAAHEEGVAGLNLVVVSLVHSVAGCRQMTPKRALRRDPTLCSDMDAITDQYNAATEWAALNESWVQIVRTPAQAREAIHEGKLAIVLSIEASDIFGASRNQQSYFYELEELLDSRRRAGELPGDNDLFAEYLERGIRRWLEGMPLVTTFQIAHQLDNAFSSAAYIKRPLTGFSQRRVGRILECRWRPPRRGAGRGTRPGELLWAAAAQYAACLEDSSRGFLGLGSGILRRPWRRSRVDSERTDGIPANPYGLSVMGRVLVDVMVAERMPIDATHMSDLALRELIEYLDEQGHTTWPVYISHTYPTASNALRREQNLDAELYKGLLRHGGLVGVRPGDDEHLVVPGLGELDEQGRHASCQGTSIGTRMHLAALRDMPVTFGTDLNGFVNQTRPSGLIRPERYLSGPTPQDCGAFIEDIGSEIRSRGLAHIGLLPALYLEMLFSADDEHERRRVAQLGNGAEAYLQLWERAWPYDVVRSPQRKVEVEILRDLIFDSDGKLLTVGLGSFHVEGTVLNLLNDERVSNVRGRVLDVEGTVLNWPNNERGPNGQGLVLDLPRWRAIESTLPYPTIVIDSPTASTSENTDAQSAEPRLSWASYPQLPVSMGLLIGTQSFARHPVGSQFPVGFCRRQRVDDRDSESWRVCDQLRRTRNLHRIPLIRLPMAPRGRFSGWRREFPNQSRWGRTIDLHLDVHTDWTLPAELPYATEAYAWLADQSSAFRQRILRNRYFENAPAPGVSNNATAEHVQLAYSEPVQRYLDNDRPAQRCLNRSGQRGPGCQAFVGIRAYCQLLAHLGEESAESYCRPFVRELGE